MPGGPGGGPHGGGPGGGGHRGGGPGGPMGRSGGPMGGPRGPMGGPPPPRRGWHRGYYGGPGCGGCLWAFILPIIVVGGITGIANLIF